MQLLTYPVENYTPAGASSIRSEFWEVLFYPVSNLSNEFRELRLDTVLRTWPRIDEGEKLVKVKSPGYEKDGDTKRGESS